jgi:hypothetical protein
MKLAGQTAIVAPGPYVSRPTGDLYAALVLCPGNVTLQSGRTITSDPPMDCTLSGEAKRHTENSVIATKPLQRRGQCRGDRGGGGEAGG